MSKANSATAGRIVRPEVWRSGDGAAGASPARTVSEGPTAEAAKPRVLVVDDDAAIVRMLRILLRGEGFEVYTASNGAEALDEAAARRHGVIVLDLSMPVMDGRAFFRELRDRGDETPVIILSAYGARRAQRELRAEAGFDKPFEPDRLIDEVQRLLKSA